MKVEVIDNQVKWDDWIKANSKYNSFAQSWDWGDILLSEGKKVERLAVVDGDKTVAQAQVVYNKLPFGWEYGFCPKGPAITYHVTHNTYQQKVYNKLIDYLRQKEKFIFFRIESSQKLLCDTCYVLRDTIDINPCATNILDLTKSEEKLLNDMKSKTRYNIRLAERKGLEVSDKKVIDAFVKLSEQTAKRDGFKLHGKKHYEEIADSIISYQLSACLPTCPPKRRKRRNLRSLRSFSPPLLLEPCHLNLACPPEWREPFFPLRLSFVFSASMPESF